MADQLRDLIDLVLDSIDQPGTDGSRLAARANFSRDHLDRLLAAATGETPVGLRKRLLLERAAWQMRSGNISAGDAAAAAGYGSSEAFTRAFSRAYGETPSDFSGSKNPIELKAPNGIHFHAPAGLLIPGSDDSRFGMDLSERLVRHHLDRVRDLLVAASALTAEELARPLRPGLVILEYEGEEASAATLAERSVYTLEVWVAAIGGQPIPSPGVGELLPRFETAAREFARLSRSIRDRGAWNDAFVDALCEPPQSFTYGGVVAHVITFGVVRREHLASVLNELGAELTSRDDPILWESEH